MAALRPRRVRSFLALASCAIGAAVVALAVTPLRAADSEVRALWVRRLCGSVFRSAIVVGSRGAFVRVLAFAFNGETP